jgi:hypothetical protein
MTAVAVELPLGLEAGQRSLIEPWELHSELAVVCPEVCARALELLPERDPEAFLLRADRPAVEPRSDEEDEPAPGLGVAVVAYALWRIGDTAQRAVVAVGLLAAVAMLAELVH